MHIFKREKETALLFSHKIGKISGFQRYFYTGPGYGME